jgi:hypothetical protein
MKLVKNNFYSNFILLNKDLAVIYNSVHHNTKSYFIGKGSGTSEILISNSSNKQCMYLFHINYSTKILQCIDDIHVHLRNAKNTNGHI